jgi:hypothetical protein
MCEIFLKNLMDTNCIRAKWCFSHIGKLRVKLFLVNSKTLFICKPMPGNIR